MYYPSSYENRHPYESYWKAGHCQRLSANHLERWQPVEEVVRPHADWTPFVDGVRGGCDSSSQIAYVKPIRKDRIRLGRDGSMKIVDWMGREALVLFVILDCPTCQDTKQMWKAYAIDAEWILGGDGPKRLLCTPRVSAAFWKRADGLLSAWKGRINETRLNRVINSLCLA